MNVARSPSTTFSTCCFVQRLRDRVAKKRVLNRRHERFPKPIGEEIQALGNCALKNAIISIASKVWRMVLMNWRQNFVLVEISKLIGLPKTTYPRRARQDLSANCCSRDTEGSFIPFHKHFHQCSKPFCLNRSIDPNTRRELCTINMTGTFIRWLVICWTAASRTIKSWMLALNTSCHVSSSLGG